MRCIDGQRLGGRISEVEAYIGEDDKASHAARGRTDRNRPMYGAPGLAYVYFIYGMYFCLNVVTEREGLPAAILIRGIEPDEGVDLMAARRAGQPVGNLASGPGKLCQALAIDRALNGHDLTIGRALWIEPGEPVADAAVLATPRDQRPRRRTCAERSVAAGCLLELVQLGANAHVVLVPAGLCAATGSGIPQD